MTTESLKAQAYDLLVQIENLQAKLRAVNQQIIKRVQEEKDEAPAA